MDDTPKQDMPPYGGYQPINYKRIPCRQVMSSKAVFGTYFLVTTVAAFVFHFTRVEIHNEEVELRSANNAIKPLLLAERDREYLKQLRKNRDEEADLMKNVEGWKVGTFYGEPVYKHAPEDTLIEPSYWEYYVHTAVKHANKRALISMQS